MLVLSPNDMPSFDFLSRVGRAKADYIPCARVGVGDASASPTVALLHSVLQDSMGRIATILFAHRLGTSLEPECKMYRLAADVLNDSALIFDCLSPALPKRLRVVVLAFSSVLRALCGVAAGSSKASLSSHFAKCGNLGELNAVRFPNVLVIAISGAAQRGFPFLFSDADQKLQKDSSQETVISLLGILCGSVVVSHISTPFATWTTLLLLLLVHLSTNYAAVRSVNMTTLNRQRTNIVFSTLFEKGSVLTPTEASKCERIFERDGILRWKASSATLGYCQIGGSFQELLRGSIHGANSIRDVGIDIYKLLRLFEKEEYVLWFNPIHKKGTIVLKNNVTPISQLQAWSHALRVAKRLTDLRREGAGRINVSPVEKEEEEDKSKQRNESVSVTNLTDPDTMFSILESTLCAHSASFADQIGMLTDAGWDVATPSLETRPARRFQVVDIIRLVGDLHVSHVTYIGRRLSYLPGQTTNGTISTVHKNLAIEAPLANPCQPDEDYVLDAHAS
ncbi:DUF647 domain-containing protein [Histoplasma capsulatum var. duboisii H88]|uniref:DUF647 domain-containing protein n=1 Tax=Ajellomyces capsulatus (strain H88) TaxID=544711 RepID=F0U5M5_AJEC8|nr:DUF647 domain-containing protein [Histoplasma capsulatum var. duboisii H88]